MKSAWPLSCVCVLAIAFAVLQGIPPADPPTRNQPLGTAIRCEERPARRAHNAAAASINKPTRNASSIPTTTPAFAEAAKAMERIKPADGLKLSVFAAEPQLPNPVALCIDEKGRFWVVETWRFDGGGPGTASTTSATATTSSTTTWPPRPSSSGSKMIKKWNNNDLRR